jgi:Ca2+-binding EF-hand superfamily protein
MVTITLDEEDDNDLEWDLQQAFDAMDEDKIGCLSIDQAYTVILGLGYLKDYRDKDRFTPEVLRVVVKGIRRKQHEPQLSEGGFTSEDGGEWVTLDDLKQILASHSNVLHRDRSISVFEHSILQMDQGNKGFIDASDIQALAASVGEPISEEEARAMIVVTRQQIASGVDELTSTNTGVTKLEFGHLQQLLSPPDEDFEKL